MDAISLIMFALSSIGMSHIIVDGSIMQWFRDLVKRISDAIRMPKLGGVVDCYLCCGTWCGFFMGYVWLTNSPLQVFGCGVAGGFLANFAAIILNLIEAMTIVNLPQDNHHEDQ